MPSQRRARIFVMIDAGVSDRGGTYAGRVSAALSRPAAVRCRSVTVAYVCYVQRTRFAQAINDERQP